MTSPSPVLTTEDKASGALTRALAPANQAPALDLPKYCGACAAKRWSIRVWDTKKTVAKAKRISWRCNSWRHPGECARRKASQDFARISAALEPVPLSSILFGVLTFDQKANYGGRNWFDPITALRGLYVAFAKLLKKLRREFGTVHYVATVEAHKSGWPHLNVIFVAPQLARHVKKHCTGSRADDVLKDLQLQSGFGPVAWWDLARSKDDLAGYCVKTAGMLLDGIRKLGAEVIKLGQLPTHAPSHFRRLRSSRGLLERARRSGTPGKVGCMVQAKANEDDYPQASKRAFDQHLRNRGLFFDLKNDLLLNAIGCAAGRLGVWVQRMIGKTWDTLIDRAFKLETKWFALNYACGVAAWLDFDRGPP